MTLTRNDGQTAPGKSVTRGLTQILSLFLPASVETWLLRACLQNGELGQESWQSWLRHIESPKRFLSQEKQGIKRLLPLLYDSAQRNNIALDKAFLTHLRTAYIREEFRSNTYRQNAREALITLSQANIPFIILKGAALAETTYRNWTLRHCHDLDIWIQPKDQVRALETLVAAGFTPLPSPKDYPTGTVAVAHLSGLPIEIHSNLFPISYYQPPVANFWARSEERQVMGVSARILAPSDMLFHICGHAVCSPKRDTLRWVCDSWYVIKQASELNWEIFIDSVIASRLALPLAVLLGYLKGELNAPMPDHVLDKLKLEADATTVIGFEAALSGVRMGKRGTFQNFLQQAGDWQSRMLLFKWLFLPSPSCLRWKYTIQPGWLLPMYYLYRPLRYLARRI